jgi:hypothetical protein
MFFVRFPYSYNLTVGKEAGGGQMYCMCPYSYSLTEEKVCV